MPLSQPRPRPRRGLVILTVLVAAFAIGWAAALPGTPGLWPDSESYLDFAPHRSPGYPAFLALVPLAAVPAVQLALFAGALLFLAEAVRRLTGSVIAGAAVVVLIFANAELVAYVDWVLSESLFASLAMVALGCLALALGHANPARWLAACALAVGAAILVRPAGYPLLVLPALAWLLTPPRRPLGLVAAVAPTMAVLALGALTMVAVHGVWSTQSFLGNNLIGKAARLADPALDGPHPEVVAAMAAAVDPDRPALAAVEHWRDRFLVLVPLYDLWRWDRLWPALPDLAGTDDPAAVDRVARDASLGVIAARPGAYAADVGLNWLALWTLPNHMTAKEAAAFDARLAALDPRPSLMPRPRQVRGGVWIWGRRLVLAAGLVATVVAGAVALRALVRRQSLAPVWGLALSAAVVVQGSLLLTALLQAGLPRYVWSAWPSLVVLVVATAAGLARWRQTP